ncbi:hypothetical protein [Sphingomonas faeni]|uniref:hypothetical protein n=1 Tax=Sphingomonas faeni TaxID=185950 RepID=UPI0020C770F5|nr:hypothetical protein [Sphingomonas faeni]MCP8891854.1 hypothetical protein [Sphingomonas faeni]
MADAMQGEPTCGSAKRERAKKGPIGDVSTGTVPTGTVPTGTVPAGTVPTGTVIAGGSHHVVQVRAVRRDGWTAARRTAFLAVLATTCNVTMSAAKVGMSRTTAQALRQRDPAFAARWAAALASGYDRLEEGLLAVTIAGLQGAGAGGAGAGGDDQGDDVVGAPVEFDASEKGGEKGGGLSPSPLLSPSSVDRLGMGSGIVPLASMQAVQVALALLNRHRAGAGQAGAKRGAHRRATPSETNAAIAKKLDSLARRLRAASKGGDA